MSLPFQFQSFVYFIIWGGEEEGKSKCHTYANMLIQNLFDSKRGMGETFLYT